MASGTKCLLKCMVMFLVSDEKLIEVWNLRSAGFSYKEISRKLNISIALIAQRLRKYKQKFGTETKAKKEDVLEIEVKKTPESADLIKIDDIVENKEQVKVSNQKIVEEIKKPTIDNSQTISMDNVVGGSSSSIPQAEASDRLKKAQEHTATLATTLFSAAFKVVTEKDLPKEQYEMMKTSLDNLAPYIVTSEVSDKNAAIAGVIIAAGTIVALNWEDINNGIKRIQRKKIEVQENKIVEQKQETKVEQVDIRKVDFVLPPS